MLVIIQTEPTKNRILLKTTFLTLDYSGGNFASKKFALESPNHEIARNGQEILEKQTGNYSLDSDGVSVMCCCAEKARTIWKKLISVGWKQKKNI